MPRTLKSVAYSFCDGFPQPYALDAIVVEAGQVQLDLHKKFSTREEFFAAIGEVVPLFPTWEEGGDPILEEGEVE